MGWGSVTVPSSTAGALIVQHSRDLHGQAERTAAKHDDGGADLGAEGLGGCECAEFVANSVDGAPALKSSK